MLLDPSARGLIRLDEKGDVRIPEIYLPDGSAAGRADIELMATAVHYMIRLLETDQDLTILFGPGSESHPHLDPQQPR